MPVPVSIVEGQVTPAPRVGFIHGSAVCEDGHVVLVMGDGRDPVIETHLDPEQVDIVCAMLQEAKRAAFEQRGSGFARKFARSPGRA